MAIDALEAALQNSTLNAMIFCEDAGPDLIVNMLRNKETSMELRTKCVEFICLLLKILYTREKSEGKSTRQLVDRLNGFLGQKLTAELRSLLDNQKELKELDPKVFENFVIRIDQRF